MYLFSTEENVVLLVSAQLNVAHNKIVAELAVKWGSGQNMLLLMDAL